MAEYGVKMDKFIKRGLGLHKAMATDLGKLGGVLRCEVCGYDEPLTNVSLALYLAEGWPTHCGDKTMVWVTEKDLVQERKTDGE